MSGPAGLSPSPRPPRPADPTSVPVVAEERGRTTVADRVIEKITAAAATEVTQADGLRRRIVGRDIGSRRARVSAVVDGSVAALNVELAVQYPASVRQVTREVRTHVIERVGRLCELRVDHVDITVAVLPRRNDESRRVR